MAKQPAWTDAEDAVVIARWNGPDAMEPEEISQLLPGRTPSAIAQRAAKLKLRRDPGYEHHNRSRSARSAYGKAARAEREVYLAGEWPPDAPRFDSIVYLAHARLAERV